MINLDALRSSPLIAALLGAVGGGTFIGTTSDAIGSIVSFPSKVIFVYETVSQPEFLAGLEAALEKENRRKAREGAQEKN